MKELEEFYVKILWRKYLNKIIAGSNDSRLDELLFLQLYISYMQ